MSTAARACLRLHGLQVRNIIQKQKIDMANEVIDAGRFDMTTTMDERKATLEAMLQASP